MSHKITHHESGEGPILILLHGYGGTTSHWDGIAENLKSNYRVVIPNISHLFLAQDKIYFSIQIEVLARYLKEYFPGQKVNLAATSYGGALAWALSLQYPELIEHLILINPLVPHPDKYFIPPEVRYFCATPWTEKGIHKALETPIGHAAVKSLTAAFRDERKPIHSQTNQLKGRKLDFVAHLIYRFTWILSNEDWNIWEAKLRQARRRPKSMVIYDDQDYLFSEPAYQSLAELLQSEDIKKISGGGHLAIKTKPSEISELIRSFVGEHSTNKVA